MPESPQVSVLMSVYNAERFLRKATDSILTQTFTDFEFIIVNDGSSDASSLILNSYQDPRVRLFQQPTNRGLIAALNLGLSHVRGRYVARMDADDVSLPDRFRRQVDLLDRYPEICVVGTNAIRIDENDRPLEIMLTPYASPHAVGARLTSGVCPLIHSSIMARTSVLHSLGGYRFQFPHSEDYDLWLRVLELGQISILSESLLMYRSNSGSIRHTRIVEATHSHEYALDCYRRRSRGLAERSRDEFLRTTQLSRAEAKRFWSLALEALMFGDLDNARTLSAEVLRRVPDHSGARIVCRIHDDTRLTAMSFLYKKYRRIRSWIGNSSLGPFLRDFKHHDRKTQVCADDR